MKKKRVSPMSDLMLKKLFANPKYYHILAALIRDFLDIPCTAKDLVSTDLYNIETYQKARDEGTLLMLTEADLRVIIHDKIRLTIEMQVRRDADFFKRASFYLASAFQKGYFYRSQMISPDRPYSSLGQTYGLNFLNFNLFEDDDVFHCYRPPYDADHDAYGFGIMVFVEFQKMITNIKDPVRRYHCECWIKFFLTGKVDLDAPKEIKEACEVVSYENLSKEEQEIMDAIERAKIEYQVRMDYELQQAKEKGLKQGIEQGIKRGIKQGIEQGIEQGSTQAKIETARKLLNEGIAINVISKATQLSVSEIEKLK
ncbi:Rpn family recombination-promoting nuclease/putative transposase [Xylocopilactobacillus apis]|uniref:Rpn family recombination-promoting nuclease/putative transposase n=1 Tax=Xylocopilactobacillus apis TaxID=2932183 RepID=A0AAU9DGB5_9LACO|nr:Rpn family recombination-promoting nuclease/putative transposase [Xylocopilactobacillus apis]BDR57301.1 hypothetical protein KIMC2_18630 [Xylocopilactobacillus apis]